MTNIKHIYSRRKDNIISKILLINSEGKEEKKIFPIFVGICDYGIIWSINDGIQPRFHLDPSFQGQGHVIDLGVVRRGQGDLVNKTDNYGRKFWNNFFRFCFSSLLITIFDFVLSLVGIWEYFECTLSKANRFAKLFLSRDHNGSCFYLIIIQALIPSQGSLKGGLTQNI